MPNKTRPWARRSGVSLSGRHASSADYECMDDCFGHRPIPTGSTRTEEFCAKCKAGRCGMRPELSTAERYVLGMVRLGKSESLQRWFQHLIPWAIGQLEGIT